MPTRQSVHFNPYEYEPGKHKNDVVVIVGSIVADSIVNASIIVGSIVAIRVKFWHHCFQQLFFKN